MAIMQVEDAVLARPTTVADVQEAIDSDGNEYLYELDETGHATIVRCCANASIVKVPDVLNGHLVTAIGDEAFAPSVTLDVGHRLPATRRVARAGLLASGLGSRRRNIAIERVTVAEGVVAIGRGAFRGCARLVDVALPESLVEIGDYAFSASGVRSIRLPKRCERLSELALRTGPACLPECNPAYSSRVERLDVEGANAQLCMYGSVLCRRIDGGLEALLCPGRAGTIDLRGDVVRVSSQAFAGTYALEELVIRESLNVDGAWGLLPNGACGRLTIELDETFGNGRTMSVKVPKALFGRSLFDALCCDGHVDAASFMKRYDKALLGLEDAFERSQLVLARLAEPLFLDDDMRERFSALVSGSFDNLCAHVGARGLWRQFDLLADAGFLNAGSIGRAIDVLSAVSDSAAVAYLLQMKCKRFMQGVWDYAL